MGLVVVVAVWILQILFYEVRGIFGGILDLIDAVRERIRRPGEERRYQERKAGRERVEASRKALSEQEEQLHWMESHRSSWHDRKWQMDEDERLRKKIEEVRIWQKERCLQLCREGLSVDSILNGVEH